MLRSPNRVLGAIIGAGFLAAGLLGFILTGPDFFSSQGVLALGTFQINGLQNLIHVVLGAALLLAAVSPVWASRRVNPIVGAVLLALGLAGLFLVGTDVNIIAVNAASNLVHFAGACVLLAVGLGADKPTRG